MIHVQELNSFPVTMLEFPFKFINSRKQFILQRTANIDKVVTAACLYPALRLDKLYAALIRCLVLWTVTKQILVFLFKGLYLLA